MVVSVPAAMSAAHPERGSRPGAVAIRLARDEADLAAMLDLGRVLHAESRYRAYPLDEARLLAAGRMGLAKGNPGLILAERDGQLIGMAVVVAGAHFFSAAKAATVQLIYVHPDHRGGRAVVLLLRALRRWAAEAGAADPHINSTTAIDAARTDRFLRRMGFRQTGGNYVLEGGDGRGAESSKLCIEGAHAFRAIDGGHPWNASPRVLSRPVRGGQPAHRTAVLPGYGWAGFGFCRHVTQRRNRRFPRYWPRRRDISSRLAD